MYGHPGTSWFFSKIVTHLIETEGGYVNDPDDPGGETKFGISKRSFPHIDIAALEYSDAVDIYLEHYWQPCQCDQLPPPLAWFVFDCAVQHGCQYGVRLIQRVLGVEMDGFIGPVTIRAAQRADLSVALCDAFSYRSHLYHRISIRRASSNRKDIFRGWLRRLFLLQQFIFEHLHPFNKTALTDD